MTLDVDWAIEEVLESVIERLRAAGVKATLFATHPSEVLRASEGDQFEIGLHPNFNDCGGDFERPIAAVKAAYPNASGGRSHSLFVSSHILELYMKHGLTYESNVFLLDQPGLRPVLRFADLVSLPFNWSDDKHFELGLPFEGKGARLGQPGLKVLNFHPIHVYMNTSSLDHYGSYREVQREFARLPEFLNEDGPGVGTMFDEVMVEIAEGGIETAQMREVADEYRAGAA